MKLIVKCKDCRAENESPLKGNTRVNIMKKHGEEFDMVCSSCNKSNRYEIDDIRADDYTFMEIVKNRIVVILIAGGISFFLGTYFIGPFAGLASSLIFLFVASAIIKKNDSKNNLEFNKHKIKGRISNIGS